MTISKETILAIVRDYHGLEVTDAELELVLADLRRYERIMNMLEELDLSKPRGSEERLVAAVAAFYRRHRAADRALAGSGETRRGWRERSRAMTSTYAKVAGRSAKRGKA